MSGYDRPLTISYGVYLDYGSGDEALAIKPPRRILSGAGNYNRNRGIIEDIHLMVAETFNQVTTQAFVRLGTASDNDYFAELGAGAAADTDGYNFRNAGSVYKIIDTVNDATIGAISQVEVNLVAPTGGTPAGMAHTTIVISWF